MSIEKIIERLCKRHNLLITIEFHSKNNDPWHVIVSECEMEVDVQGCSIRDSLLKAMPIIIHEMKRIMKERKKEKETRCANWCKRSIHDLHTIWNKMLLYNGED